MQSKCRSTPGVLLLLVLTSCASIDETVISQYKTLPQQDMAAVREESTKLIMRLLEEELVPGLSIALVDDLGPIWVEAFGVANSGTGEKVDEGTLFRIGSLTKPITALGVLQLVARQKLDIDEPLKNQLSGFSIRHHDSDAMPVTPHQLLSHRSGLPSDLRKGMYTDRPFTHVTTLLHNEYAAYHPDSVYSYSNIGYDLLGHLIQQQSGVEYAEYIDENILIPLGMRNSGFFVSEKMTVKLSAGHLDGQVRPQPPLRDTPALGLYSTGYDLGLLMSALLQQQIPGVPATLLEQMWQSQTVDDQLALGVSPGLGWFIEDHPKLGKIVRHGGATLLFGAEMVVLPSQNLGVVVLANGAESNRVARELADAILSIAASLRGNTSGQLLVQASHQDATSYSTPSGGYATDLGLLVVDSDHPRLCACIIERILDLVRFSDGSLGISQEGIDELPDGYRVLGDLRLRSRNVNGMDVLLADQDGKEIILGNRIESDPWESVWEKRLGSYRTINPDGDFSVKDLQLSEESGVLCLHYRVPHLSQNQIRLPLQPVSPREAVIQGFGRGRGETVQIVEINGKQCLKFSGFLGEPIDQD